MQARTIASQLPAFMGKKEMLVDDHDTDDIIVGIRDNHRRYAGDYAGIAEKFWAGSPEATGRKLFDFLKSNVTYDIEPQYFQSVKSPSAIVAQRRGDCKHYASFIVGVCNALASMGYPIKAWYRFTADKPGTEVHHVFAVVAGPNGQPQFWVDPVVSSFNQRPNFARAKDIHMPLYHISGTEQGNWPPTNMDMVGNTAIGANIFQKAAAGLKKAVKVNTANIKTAVKKTVNVNAANAGKGIKKVAQQAKGVALKVGISTARNAFLALLDLNAFNLATRMADARKTHGNKITDKWRELGGEPQKLLNAINNGLRHKAWANKQPPPARISGPAPAGAKRHNPRLVCRTIRECYDIGYDAFGRLPKANIGGIGVEPASTAALATLAAAIVAVFAQFMKKDPQQDQAVMQQVQQGTADMVMNAGNAMEAAANNMNTGVQTAPAQVDPNYGLKAAVGVDASGQPTIAVADYRHPQLLQAGQLEGRAIVEAPANLLRDTGASIRVQLENIWAEYKTPIMLTTVGVVAYKVATRKRKR